MDSDKVLPRHVRVSAATPSVSPVWKQITAKAFVRQWRLAWLCHISDTWFALCHFIGRRIAIGARWLGGFVSCFVVVVPDTITHMTCFAEPDKQANAMQNCSMMQIISTSQLFYDARREWRPGGEGGRTTWKRTKNHPFARKYSEKWSEYIEQMIWMRLPNQTWQTRVYSMLYLYSHKTFHSPPHIDARAEKAKWVLSSVSSHSTQTAICSIWLSRRHFLYGIFYVRLSLTAFYTYGSCLL